MMIQTKTVKVAAVQGIPFIPMNKRTTVEKACALIEETALDGAGLVSFFGEFILMFHNWILPL
jgi:hypothetical protein